MSKPSIYQPTDQQLAVFQRRCHALETRFLEGSINPESALKRLQDDVVRRVPFLADCVWRGPIGDFWTIQDGMVVRQRQSFYFVSREERRLLHQENDQWISRSKYQPHPLGLMVIEMHRPVIYTSDNQVLRLTNEVITGIGGTLGKSLFFWHYSPETEGMLFFIVTTAGCFQLEVPLKDLSNMPHLDTVLFMDGFVLRLKDGKEDKLVAYLPARDPFTVYSGKIREWETSPDSRSVVVLDDDRQLWLCRMDNEQQQLSVGGQMQNINCVCNHPTKPELWGQPRERMFIATNQGAVVITNESLCHIIPPEVDSSHCWPGIIRVSRVSLDHVGNPVFVQDDKLARYVPAKGAEILHDAFTDDMSYLPTATGAAVKRGNQLWLCDPRA